MEKLFNTISLVFAFLGGIFAKALGGWDMLLCGLIFLMCGDYVSGVVKGVYLKKLSSEIGFYGLLKKIMVLLVVAVANVIEGVLGNSIAIREIVLMFFIANESLSILENISAIGTIVPNCLRELLLQLRDKNEKQ